MTFDENLSITPVGRLLHVEAMGEGDPLVMVHGWAMHGGMLRALAKALASRFKVFLVDLPGHGHSPPVANFDQASVLDLLRRSVPSPAHWLGWSLGGLLGIAMAIRFPEQVRSLVVLNGSPCFASRPGWPGIELDALHRMANDVLHHPDLTLRRFLGLQTFGHPNARQISQEMMACLSASPRTTAALEGGVNLLIESDFRVPFSRLELPQLMVLGGRDRLVPVAIEPALFSLNSRLEIQVIPGAAHVPFLTHLDVLIERLRAFYLSVSLQEIHGRPDR